MSAEPPYVDTSALAKWYLNESGSDEFVDFIRRQRLALISRLTVVELRSLLARRRRSGDITVDYHRDAIRTFETDIRRGFLQVEPLLDSQAVVAADFIDRLRDLPLRTLDALHLAIAHTIGVRVLATADRGLVRAAEALGFTTAIFG
jgi:predicted nucleic acid-binding protein